MNLIVKSYIHMYSMANNHSYIVTKYVLIVTVFFVHED